MNNKGFTLVELLVVVAILAIASGLIATRFFGIIDSSNEFEDKSIGKTIAEAAYIFYDSKKDNEGYKNMKADTCYQAFKDSDDNVLLRKGYLSENQGLLTQKSPSELKKFYYKIIVSNKKKVAKAYKNTGACTGNDCCTNSNAKEIAEY